MIAFSLTGGALFAFMARRRGTWAGAAAAGAWALQPRLFAHGHYAHYDALLACLWVGSILAFIKAVEPRRPGVGEPAVGLGRRLRPARGGRGGDEADGLVPAAAVRRVGPDLPRPPRRAGAGGGGVVAALTLYALIPPWWGDPLGGVEGFLGSNLTRGRTT